MNEEVEKVGGSRKKLIAGIVDKQKKIKSNSIKRMIVTIIILIVFSTSMLNNVAAELKVYTIDDNGSDITINSGQVFNVSLKMGGMYYWDVGSYDSSNLEFVDKDLWLINPNPGSHYYYNWTFIGRSAGTTLLTFHHFAWEEGEYSIDDTFTLNMSVINTNQPLNLPLIITVFTIIIVVPSVIILKWMKGEEKNEK